MIKTSKKDDKELKNMFRSIILPLSHNMYKGQAGKIGIIGGSKDYTGAPYFAGISAIKIGCDLIYIFCPTEAAVSIKSYSPELMVHPYNDSLTSLNDLKPWLERLHVAVIGPGLGRDLNSYPLFKGIMEYLKSKDITIVIDADGLWMLTKDLELIKGYEKAILTPNEIEFRRLIEAFSKKSYVPIEDKLLEVKTLSKNLGNVTIVRKGCEDIISDGNNSLICDILGSPRRCGGQGDLLAGSMATFVYWGQIASKNKNSNEILKEYGPQISAAYSACFFTKTCSQISFEENGRSTTTTDLISNINSTYKFLNI